MTHFPQLNRRRRATRIKVSRPVSAIVVQESGQHTNCKLRTVSVTGGLLQVGNPLSQGDFVELAFQLNSSTVHGMAEMLSPIPQADSLLQPFRFIALDDDDHRALERLTDVANDQKSFVSSSALRGL
jgi:PilZ domain